MKNESKSKKSQNFSKMSKRFQLLPNASECIPMGPNGSESLAKLTKTPKNLRKLWKLCKNFETLREKFYKNFFHGVVWPPLRPDTLVLRQDMLSQLPGHHEYTLLFRPVISSSSFKGINRKHDDILRWVSLSDFAERFRNRSAKFRNRSAKSLSETQRKMSSRFLLILLKDDDDRSNLRSVLPT